LQTSFRPGGVVYILEKLETKLHDDLLVGKKNAVLRGLEVYIVAPRRAHNVQRNEGIFDRSATTFADAVADELPEAGNNLLECAPGRRNGPRIHGQEASPRDLVWVSVGPWEKRFDSEGVCCRMVNGRAGWSGGWPRPRYALGRQLVAEEA
jgi:hypothetical protein